MADTDTEKAETAANTVSWMNDTQRAIVLILVCTFCAILFAFSVRLTFVAQPDTLEDLAKTNHSALVNMILIGLGFFFGTNFSKVTSDRGQQRIMDKLTSASPGTLPPQPPAGAAPAAWWGKLTDAEKSAITASPDPRIKAFVTASMAGAANVDDLTYVVSKSLLTQARADEIAKST